MYTRLANACFCPARAAVANTLPTASASRPRWPRSRMLGVAPELAHIHLCWQLPGRTCPRSARKRERLLREARARVGPELLVPAGVTGADPGSRSPRPPPESARMHLYRKKRAGRYSSASGQSCTNQWPLIPLPHSLHIAPFSTHRPVFRQTIAAFRKTGVCLRVYL